MISHDRVLQLLSGELLHGPEEVDELCVALIATWSNVNERIVRDVYGKGGPMTEAWLWYLNSLAEEPAGTARVLREQLKDAARRGDWAEVAGLAMRLHGVNKL